MFSFFDSDGCPTPEIPHAIRIGGKSPPYKLANFIDYKCEPGYIMKGENHIVCTAKGWSPEPPQCIGKTEIMMCVCSKGVIALHSCHCT